MAFDVFISYRRDGGGEVARLIYDRLKLADMTVSFDKDTLQSGDFNNELLKRIAECQNFVVILSPGCFNRTVQGVPRDHDWLRIEIASALYNRKNIIPVRMPGFEFPDVLPEDIDAIRTKNWVNYDLEYIEAVCAKVKDFMVSEVPLRKQGRATAIEREWASDDVGGTSDSQDAQDLLEDDSDFVRAEAEQVYRQISRALPYEELNRIDAAWEGAEKKRSMGDVKDAIAGYLETLERAQAATPSSSAFVLRVSADGIDTRTKDWFSEVLLRAQGGDADYQYGLGTLYAEGLGVRKDSAAAVRWFGLSAQKGHAGGMAATGAALLSGVGVEIDYAYGRELLEKADALGNVLACERLGYLHEHGLGTARDLNLAKSYYERAVESGCVLATAELAGLYERGDGVPADEGKTEALYLQAADDDCVLALRRLADRYFMRAKDDDARQKALSFCRQAVELGDAESLVLLGRAYENGWGVAKDLNRAEELYREAAKSGIAAAEISLDELRAETQFRKGLAHLEGDGDVRDWTSARQWLTKAADQGHSMAMVWLGLLFERGLGGSADALEAHAIYRRAGEMGNPIGHLQAGRLCLVNYRHAKKDYDEALACFKRAASCWRNVPEEFRWWSIYAFNELGRCYRSAWGCARDTFLSARYYNFAARHGCVSACRNLASAYRDGLGVGRSQAEASHWYSEMWRLAEAGLNPLDDHAFCCLGNAAKAGDGIQRSLKCAARWWRRAIALGYLSATVDLANTGRDHREILVAGDESDFFQAYLRNAEAGCAASMCNVGLSYQCARYGLKQDSQQAFAWYAKSADCGHPTAMRYLSDMYLRGEGVPVDREMSLKWLVKAAEAGEVTAKRYVANKYYGGTSLGRDLGKVRSLLEEIIRDDPTTVWSWASLAVLYRLGIGVPEDLALANKYYQKVAESLSRGAEAQNAADQDNLANYYYWGLGVEKDVSRAVALYRKASDSDSHVAHASNRLRCIYRYGKLGKSDLALSDEYAKRYFEKLTESGNGAVRGLPTTCLEVGNCYRYGRGVAVDVQQAKVWYERAAEKKSWSAMLCLSEMLRSGELGTPDVASAESWERRAIDELHPLAENGAAEAQRALGDRYFKGQGIAQDYSVAAQWYERAYEVRNLLAMVRLAKLCQGGLGVARNESRALTLLTEAVRKESPMAAGLLGECHEKGELGLKVDYAHAVELYRRSAAEGCACGLYNLGRCLLDGVGLAPNPEEGAFWLRLAAVQKGDFFGYDQRAAEMLACRVSGEGCGLQSEGV